MCSLIRRYGSGDGSADDPEQLVDQRYGGGQSDGDRHGGTSSVECVVLQQRVDDGGGKRCMHGDADDGRRERRFECGLASSNAAVTVPATVVVPANATSAGFTATVSSVTTAQAVTLTASAGSVSKSFALQLNAAVPTLTVSPASLAFGNVTVNTATTLPVTLSSTGTAPVTINSATLSGTGFTMSGATFPVTLNPTQSVTLNVQFDPATTGRRPVS
jgi:hypothetical protein